MSKIIISEQVTIVRADGELYIVCGRIALMLKDEKIGRSDYGTKTRKYLIIWNLILGSQELEMISMRPEVLRKGLNYVKTMKRGSGLELYRIVPIEEITHFEGRPLSANISAHKNPNGIAIVDAGSVEEARRMVDNWVEGLSYGGISMQRYLKYEIKPLMELGREGKE